MTESLVFKGETKFCILRLYIAILYAVSLEKFEAKQKMFLILWTICRSDAKW